MLVLPLRGDNFTPASRTPWGGTRVAAWKRALGYAAAAPLGESWEISFGPELPSRVRGTDVALRDAVDLRALGDEQTGSALLVKLLDAGAPLSVQIHPRDDDPHLSSDESGKPECWYVAACDPGATIHFGWMPHASEGAVRAALAEGRDVSALLRAYEVEPGDFFIVPPGTPHAIGAGVTVVEPQRVHPGKRGVTYRYWDWNRRYDAAGRLDPSGEPRALHVEDALRVSDWSEQRTSFRRLGAGAVRGAPEWTTLSSPSGQDGALCFEIDVRRVVGTGASELPAARAPRGMTVVEGSVVTSGLEVRRGESVLVGAGDAVPITATAAVAIVASIPRSR